MGRPSNRRRPVSLGRINISGLAQEGVDRSAVASTRRIDERTGAREAGVRGAGLCAEGNIYGGRQTRRGPNRRRSHEHP